MFVNSDYKNWYLFNLTTQYLSLLSTKPKAVLIISDYNMYLFDFAKNNNWITITSDFPVTIEDRYDVILILKAFSKTFLLNKQLTKRTIDIYAEYENYEKKKTPIDYIVDEFNDDPARYDLYTLKKEKIACDYIRQYNNKFYREKRIFNKIEIETLNYCNNNCSFCPVNCLSDPRKHMIMDKVLFEKIIYQLSELNYDGALALFSNNEPLLDKRLYDLACYAKKELPNSYLYIFTNGKLLTPSLLEKLLVPFDHIHINNYNDNRSLIEPIDRVYSYLVKHSQFSEKVTIHLRNRNEIMSSRGGTSPNKHKNLFLDCSCILPFSQLVIRPNGQVSLCCNDALGQVTLGDINSQSLLDIWFSEMYEGIRKRIDCSRSHLSPCVNCDFIFSPLYFERI